MAHLWIRSPSGWEPLMLPADRCRVSVSPCAVAPIPADTPPGSGEILLRRSPGPERHRWLLLAPLRARLWVNDTRLAAGLCVLRDRDELRGLGAGPVYFSTEVPATVGVFPESPRPARCPRCRQALTPGRPAVCCPACETWHHEEPDCNCWTYASACALCGHSTELGAGFRWQPEEEGQ